MADSEYLFSKTSYADIQAEFEKTIAWFGKYAPGAFKRRFALYRRDIAALVEAFNARKVDELLKTRTTESLTNSMSEALELGMIRKGLASLLGQDEELALRIRKTIKGPEYAKLEQTDISTNEPRNFAFELVIAAYCAAAGYSIDLSEDADLVFEDDGRKVFIECKRPASVKTIGTNVSRALSQLTKRYDAAGFAGLKRGFVALSISKIINREQRLLSVRTQAHLSKQLGSIVERFIREREHSWQKALDIRTLGVIVYFNTAAIIEDQDLIVACRQVGLNNMTIRGTSDDLYFTEIGTKLQQSMGALKKF
ncbi:MAG: hypothetical protein AABN33_27590 [Acidobacteriota bacterium]